MALPTSPNKITFGNIENEFGQTPNRNLGAYRITETHGFMQSLPLDTGIPQSGEIRFSHFHGKRLNLIVDFYSGDTVTRRNAKTRYGNTSTVVVGGFASKPSNTSGKRVFIQVNKTIGSEKNDNVTVCALRTGTWDSGTTLSVEVGSSGLIIGAGGDGGNGSDNVSISGEDGGNGNSGLGIEYDGTTVNIYSGGRISAGGGGGGGGGAGQANYSTGGKNETQDGVITCGGGGGGGGVGFPAGSRGTALTNAEYDGTNGNDATISVRGTGGPGSSASETPTGKGVAATSASAVGGNGGDGADASFAAETGNAGGSEGTPPAGKNGKFGSTSGLSSNGGDAGESGAAIRKSDGISYTLNNSGTIVGDTNDIGVS